MRLKVYNDLVINFGRDRSGRGRLATKETLMNTIRFNPFAEVTTLRDQVNRLFDDVAQPRSDGAAANNSRLWAPLVDVSENQNEVTVRLDLPGIDPGSVDVQLTGEVLSVRGERRFERREGEGYLHLERPYGTFQRSFNLSVPVQADHVKADYKDGVLTILLPKEEAIKPRKIQIATNTDGEKG
jgi:HSP20 family protein